MAEWTSFLWWLFLYLCHNASYLSFLKKTVLLFLIILYEEAIKRLQSFLFPFSGHSSISVISFCEMGWANWIECTRRARTINLYNGTVLFYLLLSTPFLMHSLILHAFISPSLQTEQMFSPSCSQPCLFFFFLLSGYNYFRTQKRAWLIQMCCFLSASPCLRHTAFHLLSWHM